MVRGGADLGAGSPERQRYLFRDEPTDWQSVFGGSAWTQVPDGQWYLHLYDVSQPDLNWRSADVRAMFEGVLRFWLDRGVDGFRVDVAHGLIKDDTFPSYPETPLGVLAKANAPYWDQDEVHEIYRSWRAVLDEYTAADPSRPRVMCGEANVSVPRTARYVRPDEMHQTFNFPYLTTPWDAAALRTVIDESLAAYGEVGAPSTWVLSNHDVVRHASRLGYPPESPGRGRDRHRRSAAGRAARAAAGARGEHADAGAARIGVSLPGRGTWAARAHRDAGSSSVRIPTGSGRTTPNAAGTGPGCRCRGSPVRWRSASGPARPAGFRSRPDTAGTPVICRRSSRPPPSACTGPPSRCGTNSISVAVIWNGPVSPVRRCWRSGGVSFR